MQRKLTLLAVAILIIATGHAQAPLPQIRFKTGISFQRPLPSSRGYAFTAPDYRTQSLMLGGEFTHPFKSKKAAWHVGFHFEDTDNTPAPNSKNLFPSNHNPVTFLFLDGPAKTTIYAGIEKYLNRDYSNPSKNYFSIFAGAGVTFTMNKLKDWQVTTDQKFYARDGSVIEGYTSNYYRAKFPVAPMLYGGIRYNITNRKGNEVFIIELRTNWELAPYYRQTLDYTRDGVAMQDKPSHKAFSFQLNLIVPLFTFHKKTLKKLPSTSFDRR